MCVCCCCFCILLPFCWGVWCSVHYTRASDTLISFALKVMCAQHGTQGAVCTIHDDRYEEHFNKAALSSSRSNRNSNSSNADKKKSRTTVSQSFNFNAKKYQTREAAAAAAAASSPVVVNIHNDDGLHQRQQIHSKRLRTISRSFRFPFRIHANERTTRGRVGNTDDKQ